MACVSMTFKALIITTYSLAFIVSCSNEAIPVDVVKKDSDYIIKKKPQEPKNQVFIEPPRYGINYGAPSAESALPAPLSEREYTGLEKPPKEFFFSDTDKKFPWNVELHHKPLSNIKSKYNSENIKSHTGLLDIVTYSDSEVEILNLAFPDSLILNQIKEVTDGDTIVVAKKDVRNVDESSFDFKSSDVFTFDLMNIDCPDDGQVGYNRSKDKFKQLLSIANATGETKPTLKIRYRYTPQSKQPLALLSLVFGSTEVSVNRSMVYSGYCFSYSQYNQDQLLSNIQVYAQKTKKGLWFEQVKLMADDKWQMPWDYRQKNKSK